MGSNRQISRRRFMRWCTGAAVSGVLLQPELAVHATSPSAPANLRLHNYRQLLGRTDFEYLGFYKIPSRVWKPGYDWFSGMHTDDSHGLAFRWKDGTFRLLYTSTYKGQNAATDNISSALAEAIYPPEPTHDGVGPVDGAFTYWGDVYGRNRSGEIWGLFWDEQDERLYYSYGIEFYSGGEGPGENYSIGAAKLTTPGSSASLGTWLLGGQKWTRGGMTAIPSWFASSYLGGKRLGCGFGGAYSAAGEGGPCSYGLSLLAIDPPDPPNAKIPAVKLSLYGYNYDHPYQHPLRAKRPGPIDDLGSAWAYNGAYWWGQGDMMHQSAVWIDTGTKHGFLTIPALVYGHGQSTMTAVPPNPGSGNRGDTTTASCTVTVADMTKLRDDCLVGRSGYFESIAENWDVTKRIIVFVVTAVSGNQVTIELPGGPMESQRWPKLNGAIGFGAFYSESRSWGSRHMTTAMIYDPLDFAAVVSGAKLEDSLEPYATWNWLFPHMATGPDGFYGSFEGSPGGSVPRALCFDPRTNRLYIMMTGAYEGGNRYRSPGVYVYKVS